MQILQTELPGVKVLIPKKIGDNRGFFSEVFSKKILADAGIGVEFVQDNHSLSAKKGVVRGMHYQLPPIAQDKLLRVVHGAILDVVVDVRKNSPTFGKYYAVELSADNWKQIFVPIGYAHGFVTLAPNTEVLYKVSNFYSPQHERAFRWNDPAVNIPWGIDPAAAILSPRDKAHPLLADVKELF
jgi:dTDP-4-dehydrorhamnose 3,5-epimerase